MFLQSLRISAVMFISMTLLLGAAYPALTTGIIQGLFPDKAAGSFVKDSDGKIVGSALIGQNFTRPEYFWGRLSAAGYNAAASSGSNFGVNNTALHDAAQARIEALKAADPQNKMPIPVDLVTASASGLDPHISLAAAEYQARRVAKARNLSYEVVKEIVSRHAQNRQLGILGEPVVNVLTLNLDLDNAHKGK